MSDKNPPESFEQLPKQIQELFKASNVKTFFPPPTTDGTGTNSEDTDDERNKKHQATLQLIREFNLKPREIRDYLDRFVIQQAEAKQVLEELRAMADWDFFIGSVHYLPDGTEVPLKVGSGATPAVPAEMPAPTTPE